MLRCEEVAARDAFVVITFLNEKKMTRLLKILLFLAVAVLLTVVCVPFALAAGESWSVVLFVTVLAFVAEVVPSVIKKVDIDWVAPAVAVAGSIVTLLIMLC